MQDIRGSLLLFFGQLIIAASVGTLAWVIYEKPTGSGLEDLAGLVKGARGNAPTAAAEEPANPEIGDWKKMVRDFNGTSGPKDAKVTVIEYSDFECPYCVRHFTASHKKLLKEYGDKIQIVYKHFPLPFHPNAKDAAMAAQCARREGKFWPYHDELFAKSRKLSRETMFEIGEKLGLSDKFRTCLENNETEAEVEADMKDAQASRVRGTPSFLINGKFMSGAQPFDAFKKTIDPLL